MKIHRIPGRSASPEFLERFVEVRERIHRGDPWSVPEAEAHRWLVTTYARRPELEFELLLGETAGEDVARAVVGRWSSLPWAFFGLFECAEDPGAFRVLDRAIRAAARGLGAAEVQGPLDLNALHGWMFLDWSESAERWVGDPHHRPGYPGLFLAGGWEVAETAASGIVSAQAHAALLAAEPASREALEAAGLALVSGRDLPEDILFDGLWRLVQEAFTPEEHRYFPIDRETFRAQYGGLYRHLDDPASVLVVTRGDEPVGFALSYANFIDRLRDPRTAGPIPPSPPRFSGKTTAVARDHRGGPAYKALVCAVARRCEEGYRHPLAWRRVNRRQMGGPSTYARHLYADSTLTQTYVTFRASTLEGGS